MPASDFFHKKPENYNCAQAILKAWQSRIPISDEEIADFRQWGGGHAKNGECGALFAANYVLEKQGKPPVTEEFVQQVGFASCRDIKRINKTPCNRCVDIADELLLRQDRLG